MQLARGIKDKRDFTSVSKRKTRENVGPLQNAKTNPVTDDAKKAEVFNAVFSSVFTNRGSY